MSRRWDDAANLTAVTTRRREANSVKSINFASIRTTTRKRRLPAPISLVSSFSFPDTNNLVCDGNDFANRLRQRHHRRMRFPHREEPEEGDAIRSGSDDDDGVCEGRYVDDTTTPTTQNFKRPTTKVKKKYSRYPSISIALINFALALRLMSSIIAPCGAGAATATRTTILHHQRRRRNLQEMSEPYDAIQQCKIAMSAADLNRDNFLNQTEYVLFVNHLALRADKDLAEGADGYYVANEASSFDELPQELQSCYDKFASTDSNDTIDITGAKPGSVATAEQEAQIKQLCEMTTSALFNQDSVVSPNDGVEDGTPSDGSGGIGKEEEFPDYGVGSGTGHDLGGLPSDESGGMDEEKEIIVIVFPENWVPDYGVGSGTGNNGGEDVVTDSNDGDKEEELIVFPEEDLFSGTNELNVNEIFTVTYTSTTPDGVLIDCSEQIDRVQCNVDMSISDSHRNDMLSEHDYVTLVQRLSTDGSYDDVNRFQKLPSNLQENYNKFVMRSEPSTGEINISGAKPGARVSDEQNKFLNTFCCETYYIVNNPDTPYIITYWGDDSEGGGDDDAEQPDPSPTQQPLLNDNEQPDPSPTQQPSGNDNEQPVPSPDDNKQPVPSPDDIKQPVPSPDDIGGDNGESQAPTFDFDFCKRSLASSDLTRDDTLNEEEYVVFLNKITGQEFAGMTFGELDEPLRQNYYDLSNSDGKIDIHGSKPGEIDNPDMENSLLLICVDTAVALSSSEKPPSLTPPVATPSEAVAPVLVIVNDDLMPAPSPVDNYPPTTTPFSPAPNDAQPTTMIGLTNSPTKSKHEWSNPPTFNENECFADIASSDLNGDDFLDSQEYTSFVIRSTKDPSYEGLIFLELPKPLSRTYYNLVSVSQMMLEDPNTPGIYVYGAETGVDPDEEQLSFLQRVCLEVATAYSLTGGWTSSPNAAPTIIIDNNDKDNENITTPTFPPGFSEGYNSFLIMNDEGIVAADLEGGPTRDGLDEAYGIFVQKVDQEFDVLGSALESQLRRKRRMVQTADSPAVATARGDSDTIGSSLRQRGTGITRRKLEVDLVPNSTELYLIVDIDCPPDLPEGNVSCQTVFGKFQLAIEDGMDPVKVSEAYTNVTQEYISDGLLEAVLNDVDPSSNVSVVNASFPPIPTDDDISETESPIVTPIENNTGGDNTEDDIRDDTGGEGKKEKKSGMAIAGIVAVVIFSLLILGGLIWYYTAYGCPCEFGGDKKGDGDDIGVDGKEAGEKDDQNSFDEEAFDQTGLNSFFHKPKTNDNGGGVDSFGLDGIESARGSVFGASFNVQNFDEPSYESSDVRSDEISISEDEDIDAGSSASPESEHDEESDWGGSEEDKEPFIYPSVSSASEDWASSGAENDFFASSAFDGGSEEEPNLDDVQIPSSDEEPNLDDIHIPSSDEEPNLDDVHNSSYSSENDSYKSDEIKKSDEFNEDNEDRSGSFDLGDEDDHDVEENLDENASIYSSAEDSNSLERPDSAQNSEIMDSATRPMNENINSAIEEEEDSDEGVPHAENLDNSTNDDIIDSAHPAPVNVEDDFNHTSSHSEKTYKSDGDGGSSIYSDEDVSVTSATTTSEVRQQREEYRSQVQELVNQVLPDERDKLDVMMEQFKGREAELISTLQIMQERTSNERARSAVDKSKPSSTRSQNDNSTAGSKDEFNDDESYEHYNNDDDDNDAFDSFAADSFGADSFAGNRVSVFGPPIEEEEYDDNRASAFGPPIEEGEELDHDDGLRSSYGKKEGMSSFQSECGSQSLRENSTSFKDEKYGSGSFYDEEDGSRSFYDEEDGSRSYYSQDAQEDGSRSFYSQEPDASFSRSEYSDDEDATSFYSDDGVDPEF